MASPPSSVFFHNRSLPPPRLAVRHVASRRNGFQLRQSANIDPDNGTTSAGLVRQMNECLTPKREGSCWNSGRCKSSDAVTVPTYSAALPHDSHELTHKASIRLCCSTTLIVTLLTFQGGSWLMKAFAAHFMSEIKEVSNCCDAGKPGN